MDALSVYQAFAAGVLSFFAPCSIAMLPAYISYYLAGGEGAAVAPGARADRGRLAAAGAALLLGVLVFGLGVASVRRVSRGEGGLGLSQGALMLAGTALVVAGGGLWSSGRARRGVRVGLITAGGMLAVFALLGVPLYAVLHVIDLRRQTLLVMAVAVVLVALGVLGLLGRGPGFTPAVRAPTGRDARAFALFGVGYGIVAMGCNLPLFVLAVLGPIARGSGALTTAAALVAYGAGMAFLLVALTVCLAVSKGSLQHRVRAVVPYARVAGNLLLIGAGLYIAWYDWTVLRLTA